MHFFNIHKLHYISYEVIFLSRYGGLPQYCLCEVREYIVIYSDTCYLKIAHIIILVQLLRIWYWSFISWERLQGD